MSGKNYEAGYKCMCLNTRSIVNKTHKDIPDAELGLTGYVMFRRDRIGRRRGGVILYIKESIQAYEIKIREGSKLR